MMCHVSLQDVFQVVLRIDDIKIFINCEAKHAEDIAKMKRKQGMCKMLKLCVRASNLRENECVKSQSQYMCITDRYFMQYMGAFYANSVAGGLIENKMCSVDSSEVMLNVARLRDAEESERKNRAVAADGLLAMNQTQKGGKKKRE